MTTPPPDVPATPFRPPASPAQSSLGEVSEKVLTLRVGEFEGPFDLLLHLCRTSEIDLVNVPVRAITDQYLAHLEAMEFRDLETAGAYLVMAATLIYLKSKLLVPPDESDEHLD
jgi:segregation and condensation protein A